MGESSLLNSQIKVRIKELLEILLIYKKIEEKFITSKLTEYKSIIDEYFLEKIRRDYTKQIFEIIGLDEYKIAIKKLNEIIYSDNNAFSIIRIRTIEDHPQSRFTDRYEYQLIHFIRDILLLYKKEDLEPIIRYLFWRKHSIYKRLALNTIRVRYNELKQLFWEWVKKVKNPLDDINVKHELWAMANENSPMFTEDAIDTFIQWIEMKDFSFYQKGDYDSKEIETFKAYRKKEWLLALKGSKNAKVENMLKKYSEINPEDVDHPGFDIWIGGMELKKTKTTPEDLLRKSNEKIAEFLNEFTGPEKYPREGDSVYDLHNTLEFCVRDNPARFVDNLEPFKTVDLAYVSSIIGGLRDAWRSKKEFNWENVFNYIEEIISTSNFWEYKPNGDSFDYQRWTIEAIADLISEGTQKDDNAFDPSFLDEAEKILLTLSKNTPSTYEPINDVITGVLNSVKGRIYSSLLKYSLRYARLYKKSEDHRWKESIKIHFEDKLFNNPESTPEIWVTIGQFFIDLVYLDREWVFQNINKLFPKDNEQNWKSVMTAYLFYTQKIYKGIYQLIKDNRNYEKAIYTLFDPVSLNGDIRTSLTNHICIGYLEGMEKLDDEKSLINHVLIHKDPKQLEELINYFWKIKDNISIEKKPIVRNLWGNIYSVLKEEAENKIYENAISNLAMLVSIFNEIDDEMSEWIKFSAIYTPSNYNLHYLVEYLLSIAEKNPEKVGEIYLHLLDSGISPQDTFDNVKETVEKIYSAGYKDIGNQISNKYLENGHFFLRNTFNDYNE